MKWNGPGGKYFMTSDTGHVVSTSYVMGQARYSAWPAKRRVDTPALDVVNSLEEAQAICEADHQTNGERR